MLIKLVRADSLNEILNGSLDFVVLRLKLLSKTVLVNLPQDA
jgi:hypothetical protein